MPTLAERLKDAVRQLESISETPRLDAEILLAHALGYSRAQLLARLRDEMLVSDFEPLLTRRLNHEPIAYITGHWEFFSLEFLVRPPVLVPRPETEHLVETALKFLSHGTTETSTVLDIGTGTGCVAVAIAKNAVKAHVTAIDIRPEALELARENARKHAVEIDFYEGDLFEAFRGIPKTFDVIVSNPPYVEEGEWERLSPVIRKHEDPGALLAGPDGLTVIRRIVSASSEYLHAGGLIALEIGERQSPAVAALMADAGFADIRFVRDLAGIDRIARGIKQHNYVE
ncbi:MAG TPA: peptide chain release factor N(5)-glutamine methyltransferase [Candidatus Hydrogenedentes bacterium]|nr:peptide chain release factor N(5)-glutamine methyltransferase [Candidatus Hydrogenedentota bacterium]